MSSPSSDRPESAPSPTLADSVVRTAAPLGLLGLLFAAVVAYASVPLTNFDTFFHLRFGHEFLSGWSLLHPGTISTFATRRWVPTQWASEAVMAAFENWFGLGGVAWLEGATMLVYAVALFWTCRRYVPAVAAVPLTALAVVASGSGLSARPQLVSYVLIVVTAAAWLSTIEDGRARWWLVPMTWLWVGLHGMWPIGIAIGLVVAAGCLFDAGAGWRTRRRLLLVPAASLVVAALTPVGPAIYPAVLLVGSRAHYFSEWAPPNFTTPFPLVVAALVAATLALRLRRNQGTLAVDALFFLTCACTLYSERTIPVAAAVIAPLLARELGAILPAWNPASRSERTVVWAGAVAAATALAAVVSLGPGVNPAVPTWLDPELGSLPTGTVVLSEMGVGGYLAWKYPQLDLVQHGYADTFTSSELDRYRKMEELRPGWDRLVVATGAHLALLPPDSRLGYSLEHLQGWRVVRTAPDIELLAAP